MIGWLQDGSKIYGGQAEACPLHPEQPSGGAEGRSSTWDLGSRQRVSLQTPGKGLV